MEHEFGSGLRAHLDRRVAAPAAAQPAAGPPALPAPHELELTAPAPAPARRDVPEPAARPAGPTLDERIERLAAAEAELSFRERRVGEREMSFNAAVQRVVYQLAQDLLEGGAPALPRDELAVARARRGGRAA